MTTQQGSLTTIKLQDDSIFEFFFPRGDMEVKVTTDYGDKFTLDRPAAQQIINDLSKSNAKEVSTNHKVTMTSI